MGSAHEYFIKAANLCFQLGMHQLLDIFQLFEIVYLKSNQVIYYAGILCTESNTDHCFSPSRHSY